MKIWAHTMVRNEERWLWYSVASVIEHVDKVILWDTGSTDKTLEVIEVLQKKHAGKIDFKEVGDIDADKFTKIRQEMLDITDSDWFLMLDGDEVWWKESIQKVINSIKGITSSNEGKSESIIVPTVNLVGDIFHYQEKAAGRYRFGDKVGHYNLRAIKRNIPGLHSLGKHGVWGWADSDNLQIQDRNTWKFIDAPYIHATFLPRGGFKGDDDKVVKRKNKLRYEIGKSFPLDYYYPEVFFKPHPTLVTSPWLMMKPKFQMRALGETPFRKLKRRIINGPIGY